MDLMGMPDRLGTDVVFERLRQGDPVLFASDACLIVRRPGMECSLCREACPAGVLSGGLWSIKLEVAGCIGCGVCAAECPIGAIRVEGFKPDESAASTVPEALECRRVPEELRAPGATTVPCLGGLTMPDLFERAAAADRPVAIMDRGWCADCPVGGCAAPWQANLDATNALLATAGRDPASGISVVEAPLPASEAQPVAALRPEFAPSRREFFRRLVAPTPEPHRPEESRRIVFGRGLVRPIARERTLAVMRDLAEEDGLSPTLMPSVTIDTAACDLHGICAAICPTGALRLTEPGGSLVIDYDAEACIACGECQRACPNKALSLNAEGDGTVPDGRVTLASRARGVCVGCGDTFPQGRNEMHLYCQPCRNSRAFIESWSSVRGGALPQV
jgi:ferredoxin